MNFWLVFYFIATMVMLIIVVAFDVKRRNLNFAWIILPIIFGPPGAMAYFIGRPPYKGE